MLLPTQTWRQQGFTLIEIMVALAVESIALLAGSQAVTALARGAQRQSDVLLAQMCAENELVRVRLSRQLPDVGDNDIACEQAGRSFVVKVTVRPTPNPNFRRVDAQVMDAEYSLLRLSTVKGRY